VKNTPNPSASDGASGDGVPLPPGAERRRQLRQQRRAEQLRHLWRFVVFSGISAGLGFVLLRQGWNLRQPNQVEVTGSSLVNRDQVIQAAGLHFPQPLLELQPKQLGQQLMATLPVEKVKVSRLLLPARLRIDLVDREAVARAQRRGANGIEQGYVDESGQWISAHHQLGVRTRGNLKLEVLGWNERHRAILAEVLKASGPIGPGLRQIRFQPDGSLWLKTVELGEIRLGPSDSRLPRRLEVVAQLNRALPSQLGGRRPQLIDLSDPEQPELSMAAGKGSGAAAPP
jgi:cell division protein FtsQ